ncbi:MAG TPA: CRISPR-associated helicase/endonuclease Cas3, partial [Clostridiaceae bacterium]|nr:CRISPR-associated helicase/endonuclease Cas3 [Clostridiaceae bacterium]
IRLSAENWDIPVVVTTNVQFFESLFSNRSSKCRKLHNIANSIIIFDEAQMLPIDFLRPCVQSIAELVTNYGCTVVLCTATQPALNDFFPETLKPAEIMESPSELYNCFKRVKVTLKGSYDDEELSNELLDHNQVLCIVNTRKHAQVLFSKLSEYGLAFHLSTYMCPVHRLEIIKKIKYYLDNNLQCRVVATPLIEAGVDLDFPVVYRAVAGLDSIIQAAGRCNRNGKLEVGKVYVFYSKEKHGMPLKGRNSRMVQIMEMIFRKFEDPVSLDAIKEYFEQLYDIEGDDRLDKEGIINMFEEGSGYLDFKFEEAAEKFKLIKNNTIPIVMPYDESAESLINEARNSMFPASLMRKLQPYTITVYENEFRELLAMGAIENIKGIFNVLIDKKLYNSDTGLSTTGIESYGDALFA